MNGLVFLPELVLLLGSLLVFFVTLGHGRTGAARGLSVATAVGALICSLATLGQEADLFFGAYRIDLFSQLFKTAITLGLVLVLLVGGRLRDIVEEARPEYHLFLLLSAVGLVMLVSSVELITLFVALELSSYSVYLLVPMRNDRRGLRAQMEAAIKYVMFGVVASFWSLYLNWQGLVSHGKVGGGAALIIIIAAFVVLGVSMAVLIGLLFSLAGQYGIQMPEYRSF